MRQRIELLRLARHLGVGMVLGLILSIFLLFALPTMTAGFLGYFVHRTIQVTAEPQPDISALLTPLLLITVTLLLDLTATDITDAVREWAAHRINGRVRHQIRSGLARFRDVSNLDDQMVRDASSLSVSESSMLNLGAGVVGQIWLIARYASAIAQAALVAWCSVPAAVIAITCMVAQRIMLVRKYSSVLSSVGQRQAAIRASAYWEEVAGGRAGAKDIRIFGFGPWAGRQFDKNARVEADMMRQLMRSIFPQHGFAFLLSAAATGIPFVILTRSAIDGDLSVPKLSMCFGALIGLTALGSMGLEAICITAGIAQLDALKTVEDLSQARRDETDSTEFDRAGAGPGLDVRFEDVWFRYPGTDRDVIRGLSLHIAPGEDVALVGSNGIGKTTLLKLLCGFYVPTKGRILVDGVDVQDIPAALWHHQLAVVLQDFLRLELSAADNVSLARPNSGPQIGMADAAQAMGVLQLIESLPDGWGTVLSPDYINGADLSGGQWQRLALARALHATSYGARLLLLDEPTSALDVQSETELFDTVLEHAAGVNVIVVSHRFSTVRRVGRIVVLDAGQVIEDGTHRQLMELRGTYHRLHELQARRFIHAGSEHSAES